MRTKRNLTLHDLYLIEKALRKNTPKEIIKNVWSEVHQSELEQFIDLQKVEAYINAKGEKPSNYKVAKQ